MRKSRIRLTLAIAALTLALAASSASAFILSSDDSTFSVVWRELTFTYSSGERVTCPLTLGGTLHSRAIFKSLHRLTGSVNFAQTSRGICSAVTVVAARLPWHLTYESFSGTLPNITEINIALIGMSFAVRGGLGQVCLMESTALEPALFSMQRSGTAITQAVPLRSVIDTSDTTGTSCDVLGLDISLSGAGGVTDSGGAALNVTLP